MRPPHFVVVVATAVLSGYIWLGPIQKIQGLEIGAVTSPAVGEQGADFVLAKNDGTIAAVPVHAQPLLPRNDRRDSALLLLIGASLLTIAAGIRRLGAAVGESADTNARHESTSRTHLNEISATVSRSL